MILKLKIYTMIGSYSRSILYQDNSEIPNYKYNYFKSIYKQKPKYKKRKKINYFKSQIKDYERSKLPVYNLYLQQKDTKLRIAIENNKLEIEQK